MYQLHYDGTTHLYDSRDEAVDALCEKVDARIGEFVITPDRLTALTVDDDAWSDWPDDGKRDVLEDVVRDHCPIEEIAREAVASGMEYRFHEDDTPADAVPWYSDDYEYDVRDWFGEYVNGDAFAALDDMDVVDDVREVMMMAVRDEMSELWDDYPHTLDGIDALSEADAQTLFEVGFTTPIDVDEASEDELLRHLDVDVVEDVREELSSDGSLAELVG